MEDAAPNLADDQVASNDEYENDLAEGVQDDSTLDPQPAREYTITSYGADYTVDSLVKRMNHGAFKIPDFQRRFIWSQTHASRFIESLLMGLPVPGIFLYKEASTGKHLVIDGQQRLRSLQAFYRGLFGEKKFRLKGVREPWLDKTYEDLTPSDQLRLDDSIVHATIFTQDRPKDSLDSIHFVFERINSGGIRLSPQEIRNCISAGKAVDFVKELNSNEDWRTIYGPMSSRAKDEELVLRYAALFSDYSNYSRPMSKFLNDFAEQMNEMNERQLEYIRLNFTDAVGLINAGLDGRAFRPVRALNAAVFDAVMVGVATRLAGDRAGGRPPMEADDLVVRYEVLLANDDFRDKWIRATSDDDTVKARIRLAIEAFAR